MALGGILATRDHSAVDPGDDLVLDTLGWNNEARGARVTELLLGEARVLGEELGVGALEDDRLALCGTDGNGDLARTNFTVEH